MKHDITSLKDGLWSVKLDDRGLGMSIRHKDDPLSVEYCFVCMERLTDDTGRVVLRPLVDTGERSAIPLKDRRVTMCSTHAAEAIEAKTHAAA